MSRKPPAAAWDPPASSRRAPSASLRRTASTFADANSAGLRPARRLRSAQPHSPPVRASANPQAPPGASLEVGEKWRLVPVLRQYGSVPVSMSTGGVKSSSRDCPYRKPLQLGNKRSPAFGLDLLVAADPDVYGRRPRGTYSEPCSPSSSRSCGHALPCSLRSWPCGTSSLWLSDR